MEKEFELKEDKLQDVTGGIEEEYQYTFKKNDRVNTSKSSNYLIIEENVMTNDITQKVKVTEHTRGENAKVYSGSYCSRTVEQLLRAYELYGGILG